MDWELDHKEGRSPKNWCFQTVVLEKTLERPLECKEIKSVNLEYSLEGQMLKWSSSTLATWCEKPTHQKRPWCWERLKAGEEGSRGWDVWMASLIWCTQTWANSRRCWGTGRSGRLQSMGLQRVRHDWQLNNNSVINLTSFQFFLIYWNWLYQPWNFPWTSPWKGLPRCLSE